MEQYQRYDMRYVSMILCCCVFFTRVVKSQIIASQFNIEDSCLYSSGILSTTTVRRSARCALLCHLREDCVAYGYDPVAKSCRLGESFLPEPCSDAAPSIAGEFVYVSELKQEAYLETLACQSSDDPTESRDDIIGQIQPQTATSLGTWGVDDMCPSGTYATGFQLKIEEDQGSGDDTALNGIELRCRSPCDNPGSIVTSTVRGTGDWTDVQTCNDGSYLAGAQVKSEEDQGFGDDTAVNDYDFECKSASSNEQTTLYGSGGPDGDWSDWESCPPGSYVCGLKTRVQPDQGWHTDDSALTMLYFTAVDIIDLCIN